MKDLHFAIAHINDISHKTAEEHLGHLQQVFHKLCNAKLSMKLSMCHFLAKEIQYLGHVLSTTSIKPLLLKTEVIKLMWPKRNTKQVWAFLGLVGCYIKNFAWIAKPLTTLMCHYAKFDWTPHHQVVFVSLKGALIQASILHYPDYLKWYIVYTDASDNTCDA